MKAYYFYNIDEFNQKEKEIIKFCKEFHCRAGINLNKRNNRTALLELLAQVTDRVISENYEGVNHIMSSVNGRERSKDKIWLIDVDDVTHLSKVLDILPDLKPVGKQKLIRILPTYSGYHVITDKFDSYEFDKEMQRLGLKVDIHKNNPVCLYYPEMDTEENEEL